MKDNEIKRLINRCSEGMEESEIGAEEIRREVMAKIKGNVSASEFGGEEEFVQPEPVRMKPRRSIAFTAAAAAVCVGVGAGGIALAGNIDFDALSGLLEGGEQLSEPSDSDTAQTEENFEKRTGVLTFTLIDGTVYTYDFDNDSVTGSHPGKQVLEVRDGVLWFTGNGENINVPATAGGDDYYIYKYINKDTGKEHQVIISNTINPMYCGYMELYSLEEDADGHLIYRGDGENSYIVSFPVLPSDSGSDGLGVVEQYWLKSALDDLGLLRGNDEAHGDYVFECGSDVPVLPYDGLTMDLVDNTRFVWSEEGQCWQKKWDGMNVHEDYNQVFREKEDGSIHYIAFMEDTDITDKIDFNTPYIRFYLPLSGNCERHYVIVGGTSAGGDLGYAEIFCKNGKWYGTSYNACVNGEFRQWFDTALDWAGIDDFYGNCTMNRDRKEILDCDKTVDFSAEEIKNLSFTLLDGTVCSWGMSQDDFNENGLNVAPILKRVNGRIIYLGGGEQDVTDLMDESTPYITSYVNPDTGLTHYVAMGGIPESRKFGYAEMVKINMHWYIIGYNTNKYNIGSVYKLDDDGNLVLSDEARFEKDEMYGKPVTNGTQYRHEFLIQSSLHEYSEWMRKAFEELGVYLDGCGLTAGSSIGNVSSFHKTLDGSAEIVNDYYYEFTTETRPAATDILSIEDGKLWFTGNGKHIDVAEAAGDKDYYIYTYIPEGYGIEQKVIIANTADPEENGYIEIYPEYHSEMKVDYYRGLGNNVYTWGENIADGPEDIKPWLKHALEELGLRCVGNDEIAKDGLVIARG